MKKSIHFYHTFRIAITLLLLMAGTAEAKVIGLMRWPSKDGNIQLVLPIFEKEDPVKTAEHYQTALLSSPTYQSLPKFADMAPAVFASLDLKQIKSISSDSFGHQEKEVPVITFANRIALMSAKESTTDQIYRDFRINGAHIFIIPLGIELLLTNQGDFEEYADLLASHFAAFFSLGGGDVDPSLYGEKNTHSANTNAHRDMTEVKLIQKYLEVGQGVFYGLCRGHQIYAVATGGKLFQDLSLQGSHLNEIHNAKSGENREKISSWHPIKLIDKNNALYAATGKLEFLVNSRHHQAVKLAPKGRIIAQEGPVIEAIEKRDSHGNVRVLTTQFHPEDIDSEEMTQIFRWMIENARKLSRHSKS